MTSGPHHHARGHGRPGDRHTYDQSRVDSAVEGDPIALSVRERQAAIDALDTGLLSAEQVAVRLHVTSRTVQRRRAQRRAGEAGHA